MRIASVVPAGASRVQTLLFIAPLVLSGSNRLKRIHNRTGHGNLGILCQLWPVFVTRWAFSL